MTTGQPMVNLPPGIKAVALFLLTVHVLRLFLPAWLDDALVERLAFIPQRYDGLMAPGGFRQAFDWPLLTSPITYMALHASWLHLGFNLLSLVAFGTPVERLAGPRRMLAIFVLSGIGGAFLEACLAGPGRVVLIGASGGISGLFAVAFLAYAPAQSLWHRVAGITILGGCLVLSSVMGLPGNALPIAWAAHLGGFVTGLLLVRLARRQS